jgi:hypothetical protein
VAVAAAPVDREATGWFESEAAPVGGPTVQRRVDRRTKRMDAYPPIDRKAHPPAQQPPAGDPPSNGRDPRGGSPPRQDPGP